MGTLKCQNVAGILEELAPKKLAENWDNVGLLVGDGKQQVRKLMVCLDVPEWVLDEAVEEKVDMIVCHHPMIFSGIKRINTDTPIGRKIMKLIRNNISLYCLHTNYDMASGGLNDLMARQLGFASWQTIQPLQKEKLYKLVVFVPTGHETAVIEALCRAGAGFIGKYSNCSFRTPGMGTFEPQEGAQPFTGKIGHLENTEEYRVETIVPEQLLNKAVKEMLKAHPYEEVAYDIYQTFNEGKVFGLGRLAELENGISLSLYAESVKKLLDIPHIRFAGDPNKLIKKVALLNGAGNKFASDARFAGADLLITGDVQYHELLDAVEMGLCVIDAGHYGTEKIMMKSIAAFLKGRFDDLKYQVEVIESRANVDMVSVL